MVPINVVNDEIWGTSWTYRTIIQNHEEVKPQVFNGICIAKHTGLACARDVLFDETPQICRMREASCSDCWCQLSFLPVPTSRNRRGLGKACKSEGTRRLTNNLGFLKEPGQRYHFGQARFIRRATDFGPRRLIKRFGRQSSTAKALAGNLIGLNRRQWTWVLSNGVPLQLICLLSCLKRSEKVKALCICSCQVVSVDGALWSIYDELIVNIRSITGSFFWRALKDRSKLSCRIATTLHHIRIQQRVGSVPETRDYSKIKSTGQGKVWKASNHDETLKCGPWAFGFLWKKCFRNLDFLIWISMVSIHTIQDIQGIPVEQN